MKRLTKSFICAFLVLSSTLIRAMESDFKGFLRKINGTKTQMTSCNFSLSTVLDRLKNKYLARFLALGPAYPAPYIGTEIRDFLYCGKPIGNVSYTDSKSDYHPNKPNAVSRYINRIEVNATHRAQGYGTYFMQRFIEQSQRDGVSSLALYALPKSLSFYLNHLGFSPCTPGSSVLYKKITPLDHNHPLATAGH